MHTVAAPSWDMSNGNVAHPNTCPQGKECLCLLGGISAWLYHCGDPQGNVSALLTSTRSLISGSCGYQHLLCHLQVPRLANWGCWWTPGSCLPDVQLGELLQLLLHVLLQLPGAKENLADGADWSLAVKQSRFLFACGRKKGEKALALISCHQHLLYSALLPVPAEV